MMDWNEINRKVFEKFSDEVRLNAIENYIKSLPENMDIVVEEDESL